MKTIFYNKLKRVWSHNDMNYIPKFRETFPELNKVSSEEMCDRWISLGIDFYTEKKTPVRPLLRITLPFALLILSLMLVCLPINFIITGEWSYSLKKGNYIYNWFSALGL